MEEDADDPSQLEEDGESNREFVVEKILDKRVRNGRIEYYISWKGFDQEKNSWKFNENLNCPELIKAFEDKLKSKKEVSKRKNETASTLEGSGSGSSDSDDE